MRRTPQRKRACGLGVSHIIRAAETAAAKTAAAKVFARVMTEAA